MKDYTQVIIEIISDTFDISLDYASERFEQWRNQNEYPNLFNDFISYYDTWYNEDEEQ